MSRRLALYTAATVILGVVTTRHAAVAQSPFTTAKADGSIILDRGGFVQATFTDALFRLGYTLDRVDQQWQALMDRDPAAVFHLGRRYGFEVQAKPGGNVASLFKANELVAGGRLAFSFSLTDLFASRPSKNELTGARQVPTTRGVNLIEDWLTIEAGVESSNVGLYDPSLAFGDQFFNKKFVGASTALHYNAEFGGPLPTVLGLSLGALRANNSDDLTAVSVVDRRGVSSPDGATQRISERTRKGLSGTYEVNTPVTLNTDLVIYPFLTPGKNGTTEEVKSSAKASVAFDLFTRSELSADQSFIPGVGAYLTAPGAPLKVYGGVSVFVDKNHKVGSNIAAGFAF